MTKGQRENLYRKRRRIRDPAYRNRENAKSRAKYARNREQRKAYMRSRRARAGYSRSVNLKHNYNITPAEWNAIFASQGFRCKCCGTDTPNSKNGWCTDHDHSTGRTRGILCHKCNAGLGHFNDDPELLYAAIRYLLPSR